MFYTQKKREWAQKQAPTYPSVVLYAVVDRNVIPEDTAPIEMLVGNPDRLDESEVTAYILSIDDKTLCKENEHTIVAIGPTFESWDASDKGEYQKKKQKEQARLISVLEKRFPGFEKAVGYDCAAFFQGYSHLLCAKLLWVVPGLPLSQGRHRCSRSNRNGLHPTCWRRDID